MPNNLQKGRGHWYCPFCRQSGEGWIGTATHCPTEKCDNVVVAIKPAVEEGGSSFSGIFDGQWMCPCGNKGLGMIGEESSCYSCGKPIFIQPLTEKALV